ncbi:MAG: ABC transporter permease [Chloroflexota bacterium]|nr:MAG: ABC transporter permease [Chloroflexota bacterium]
MSASAVPVAGAQAARGGGTRPRAGNRGDGLVERYFRVHTGLVYLFLYLPILVVIVFAFNATDTRVTLWRGFSPKWFGIALTDPVVQKYVLNSFIVAVPNAILATLFGTMAALGLQRVGKRVRLAFDALTYVSVIVPEIVIALATLVLFATSFDAIEAFFGVGRPGFGFHTIIAAHMLFNISLVLLLVRARLSTMDRTHVEASYDLFAPPWPTFRQITLPQLLPAIMAGFLLSFTFSFDDYVITTFTSGPGSTTIPLYIFGAIKKGVTPETNAVATMMLILTLALLALGQWILGRQSRRQGGSESMTGIIIDQS